MIVRTSWGVALCFLAPMCIGCTSAPGVVRGQSPSARDSMVHQAGHHADYVLDQNSEVHGGPYIGPGESCPPGGGGRSNCHEWQPTHNLWYQYNQPRDLVYPAENTPAAVVQYPYYTCKGPDDFFLK